MSDIAVLAVILIGVVFLLALAYLFLRQSRRRKLEQEFGPEYRHTVQETGSHGRAERELEARRKRVSQLELRDLTGEERQSFTTRWREVQALFVDRPSAAVEEADLLIAEAMKARGYRIGDLHQQEADVSVHHPQTVGDYRTAHDITLRHRSGEASTEELRQAMVLYRNLFEELVGPEVPVGGTDARRADERRWDRPPEHAGRPHTPSRVSP